jgi:hypothetical protein
MKKPQMILFDYGNTLLYEKNMNFLRGYRAATASGGIPEKSRLQKKNFERTILSSTNFKYFH